ncbi:MAG: hypothetical protein ACQES8_08305 [Thermodesulfobacteriota bacterium]
MPRESENNLSTEEAIQRLKWEIIAQDWSLSVKRISLLEEAFLFLKHYYADRKPAHNILIMADSLLHYIKNREDNIPSESIDFLKEAMAHIVNIYETEDLKTEKEEHLFKILYYRFNKLKGKIKYDKSAKEDLEIKAEEQFFEPEKIEQIKEKIHALQVESGPGYDSPAHETESLLRELQATMDKAEELIARIRRAVNELRSLENRGNSPGETGEASPIRNCPPTELRKIVIEGCPLYIQESAIARIKRLSPSKLGRIHEKKVIPVKDLACPFKKLPKQFKGILGSLSTEELKKTGLPVIVPQGQGLPDHPDTRGNKAVIISKGNLAGILICSEVDRKTINMTKFQMTKDDDTISTGYTKQGDCLRVINLANVLKQDGMAIS